MSGGGKPATSTRSRAAAPGVVAPPPGYRFSGLDSLRGMAAIAVVVTQCAA